MTYELESTEGSVKTGWNEEGDAISERDETASVLLSMVLGPTTTRGLRKLRFI